MADIAPPQWNAPELQPMRDLIMAHFRGNEEDTIARMQALLEPPGDPDPSGTYLATFFDLFTFFYLSILISRPVTSIYLEGDCD